MFTPSTQGRLQKDVTRLQLFLLVSACLGILHLLLYNLRPVLMPFVLSGFLVAAVEPSAELLYRLLAGLVPPYRWCCCCCRRVQRNNASDVRASFAAAGAALKNYATCTDPPSKEQTSGTPRGGGQAGAEAEKETDEESPPPPHNCLADDSGQDVDAVWESVCRLLAVMLTVMAILLVLCCFVLLVFRGALHLQSSWPAYREGMKQWISWFDSVTTTVSKSVNLDERIETKLKAIYNNILSVLQDSIYACVTLLVESMSAGVSTVVIVLLYVLLWLSRPLPMGGNTGSLVRSYIWKKTLTSCCYGFCVTVLFLVLGLDLAYFFGMISFFLNYVPEVGAAFSMLVPLPVILLDGRLQSPVFCMTMALIGQLLLKMIISDFLEVKLVEQDAEMSIHPVWVLLGLNYFGFIWGPTGMLVSVPVLAMLKSAAISARQSDEFASREWVGCFLACLEGRAGASATDLFDAIANVKATRSPVGSGCSTPTRMSPRGSFEALDASSTKKPEKEVDEAPSSSSADRIHSANEQERQGQAASSSERPLQEREQMAP